MGNLEPCKKGHRLKRRANGECGECSNIRSAAYRARNLEKTVRRVNHCREGNPRKTAEQRVAYRVEKRASYLVREARHRAKKKAVPFDIDQHVDHYQTIIDAGACQLTGLPFVMASVAGRPHPSAPSLDRIKPELGYVRGNVRVILSALNTALGNWGQETYVQIAKAFMTNNPWVQP